MTEERRDLLVQQDCPLPALNMIGDARAVVRLADPIDTGRIAEGRSPRV